MDIRKLLTVLLLVWAAPLFAQTTTVTGTIVDPNGNPYANGTASATKAVPLGQNQGTPVNVTTSNTGLFTMSGTNALPSPASYIFTVCARPTQLGPTGNPTPTLICFSNINPIAISGGSQDVSGPLNAVAAILGPNFTTVTAVGLQGPGNILGTFGGSPTMNGTWTFAVPISGSVAGNAGTATALATAPAQCGANSVAAGVTATGAANCTATPTVIALNTTTLNTINTNSTGPGVHSGPETFTGALNTTNLAAEIYPSGLPGADCGLKIINALALLPASGGVLRINKACGVGTATAPWSTFVLPAHVALSCIEPATYWTSQIQIGTSGSPQNVVSIFGVPTAPVFLTTDGMCIFEQGNNVNANPYISGWGSNIALRDMVFDGNVANNSTSGPVVEIFGSANTIENVAVRNGHSHCVQLGNGSASPVRGAVTIVGDSMLNNCTGSGLFLNDVTDVWVRTSNLDNNSRYGIECIGCGGIRVVHNDLGGNTLWGMLISGSAAFQSGVSHVQANVFKNNLAGDLDMESDLAGTADTFSVAVVGNLFGGLGVTGSGPAIRSNGSGNHVISGNIIRSGTPNYTVCINIVNIAQELTDIVTGNQCLGSFPTTVFTSSPNTFYDDNNFAGFGTGTGMAPFRTFVETTAPNGAANMDVFYGDFSTHHPKMNNNNAGLETVGSALIYTSNGAEQLGTPHIVQDTATLAAGTVTITFIGSAVFTNATSYSCTADDDTAIAATRVLQNSGVSITITGTGTDVIRYVCAGN